MTQFNLTSRTGQPIAVMLCNEGGTFGLFSVSDDLCVAHGVARSFDGKTITVAINETSDDFDAATVEHELQSIMTSAVKR